MLWEFWTYFNILSLFLPSGQNQEKGINAQLVLSTCSFTHDIVNTSTKSQHASIFMNIKVNDIINNNTIKFYVIDDII